MEEKQNVYELAAHLKETFKRVMVGEVDEYVAFIVRIEGSYLFHEHIGDEMYLVLEGEIAVDYGDGSTSVTLSKGDTLVAKAGEKHRSRSDNGATVLIFKHKDYMHGKTVD